MAPRDRSRPRTAGMWERSRTNLGRVEYEQASDMLEGDEDIGRAGDGLPVI